MSPHEPLLVTCIKSLLDLKLSLQLDQDSTQVTNAGGRSRLIIERIIMMKYMSPITVLIFSFISTLSQAQTLTVDYTWKRKHQCSTSSPELKVDGIPANTVELSITMIDHDMRSFNHGGGFVKNEAGFPSSYVLPEGALKSYKGPCPPNFASLGHDYEFIVVAKDKSNKELTKGSKKKTFSAKEVKE